MKWKHVLVAGTAAVALLGSSTAAIAVDSERIGGADRYATSVEISKRTFEETAAMVFLASGEDFPDALVAGAAAGFSGAPVLLTRNTQIPEVVKAELARLKPVEIVIVGGPGAVSAEVAAEAKAWGKVTRLGGANRYETANLVADRFLWDAVDAFLVSGEDFPDALSGGVPAALLGSPLLLTNSTELSEETAAYLEDIEPREVFILGGEGAVSDTVAASVAEFARAKVSRVSGADRYATSAAVSRRLFAKGATVAVLASGVGYPDGLSGTPMATSMQAPLLLVSPNTLPPVICDELRLLAPDRVLALGGKGAVSDRVIEQAKKCAGVFNPAPGPAPKPDPDGTITPKPTPSST